MSELELRHLESFLAVAEEGQFTRAASRLHIAQPPLSRRIKELETVLRASLFDRTTRHVRLTLAGRIFLEKVQVTMQALNLAMAAVRQAEQGIIGSLRVGYTGIASDSILPRLIHEFRTLHPKVGLDILGPFTAGELALSLLNEEIDAAVCFLPPPNKRLESRTLIVTELVLVLSDRHPLARARRVSLRDVAEESFVTYPANEGFSLRAAVDAVCARAGFRPRVVRESRWSRTLLCLVAADVGVAIVPKEQQKHGMEGVNFHSLHPAQLPLHQGVVWRKGDTNPLVANLVAVAERSFPRNRKRT